MLSLMEKHTGKRPIIYTDIIFHSNVLEGDLAAYDFWLRSVAAEPEHLFEDRPWIFWQYSATGRVPGIQGDVDRNAFNGSDQEWKRWLHTGRIGMQRSRGPSAASSVRMWLRR